MSKGGDIPYQLRPNKFIDRQIFLDLCGKIIPGRKWGQYIYVSMGGKHLVDHEAIYRRLGIANLYSFDGDEGVVARQECNKPITTQVCRQLHSSSLAGELDGILASFAPASSLIVWLDYTKPADRLSQLQEFTECLRHAKSGDVFRITMNADDYTLRGNWKEAGFERPSQYRAQRLEQQIGDYFYEKILQIEENGLPKALSRSISLACSKAEQNSRIKFTPVLLTSYADGQRMFTATVYAHTNGESLPTGLVGWEFMPKNWDEVITISVPDLSLREKAIIDQHLNKAPSRIIRAIKFAPVSELDQANEAVASYKKLHRYYPTFMAIGVQ